MTLKTSIIIGAMIATLLTSGIAAAAFSSNAYASALDPSSDFDERPERVCISYGEDPEMKDLCESVDICDEEGVVKPDDKFCTGEAVRGLPYPPGGCPEGFHSVEDDESGLCYSDDIPCPEGLEMREFENAEGHGCEGPPWCERVPNAWNCISKETFCNSDAVRYQEHIVYCMTSEPDRCNSSLEGSRCNDN